MGKIEEIERAIEALSPVEYARLRAWFEALDAQVFDQKIERDALAGELDSLAQQALADHQGGKSRKL